MCGRRHWLQQVHAARGAVAVCAVTRAQVTSLSLQTMVLSCCSRRQALVLTLLLIGPLWVVPAAWAGPVNWQEVPATSEGRQWWDSGSLRRNREGNVELSCPREVHHRHFQKLLAVFERHLEQIRFEERVLYSRRTPTC